MATETLRPNAAGDTTDIPTQYPNSTFHWDKVDEVSADGDTTYVESADSTTRYLDLYNLPASSGAGTINSIKVYAVAKVTGGSSTGSLDIGFKTDEYSIYYTKLATTSYATQSQQWNTNPDTESAWTWEEIDDLQIGIRLRRGSEAGALTRCTQVYVEIDYTTQQDYTRTSALTIGDAMSATRVLVAYRAPSLTIGNAVSVSRLFKSIKAAPLSIGDAVTATRVFGRVRTAAITTGIAVTTARTITWARLAAITTGISISITRALAWIKSAPLIIGNAVTVVTSISWSRVALITEGIVITVSRLRTTIRSSAVTVGITVSAIKRLAAPRIAAVTIGTVVSVVRIYGRYRTAALTIGVAITVLWWERVVALTLRVRSLAMTLLDRTIALTLKRRIGG